MSRSAIWTWNEETPGRVPAGARLSAGKVGEGGGAVSGELHAVARVSGEPDGDDVDVLGVLYRFDRWCFGHGPTYSSVADVGRRPAVPAPALTGSGTVSSSRFSARAIVLLSGLHPARGAGN